MSCDSARLVGVARRPVPGARFRGAVALVACDSSLAKADSAGLRVEVSAGEVRPPVGDAGRAVQAIRCGELDASAERAVVGGEEVRAAVGMRICDPDRVQFVRADVPLQLSRRPSACVPVLA